MDKERIIDMRHNILNTFTDAMSNLFYYDRKEDENLKVGEIEKAIKLGIVKKEELVEILTKELEE